MMNKMISYFIVILVILSGLLLWLGTGGDKVIKTFDRTGEEIILTVQMYNNQFELVNAINTRLGYEVDPDHLGLAIYSPDDNICEIFTLVPTRVDGERTKTIGHEVLHCLYGELHD